MPSDKPLSDDEWLEQFSGRVHGFNTVMLAIAASHPEPQLFLSELERVEQFSLAQAENTLLSDRYIEGMRQSIDLVRTALNLRLARK